MNPLYHLRNPCHKANEGDKDASRTAATKDVGAVNLILIVDSRNLFNLPQRVHWKDTISFSHVGFPYELLMPQFSPVQVHQHLPEVHHVV
jgi:hypothetical protein